MSFEAQQRAWLDAAELADLKWDKVMGEVLPTAQDHVARLLRLPDGASVCFAPSTHDLLTRLLASIEAQPFRVLTTDSEFHSMSRQLQRLEQAQRCVVERVAVEPFADFPERFIKAAASGGHHLVFLSQVMFNSGYVVQRLEEIVAAVPSRRTLIVVDGYHAFMALPVDFSRLAERAFYVAGGYKYAMAGEGACFMHCPPGYVPEPLYTGWFAGFAALESGPAGRVAYAADGSRFMGATFDPTALYRFNAVMGWLQQQQLTPARIHAHVHSLQEQFLQQVEALWLKGVNSAYLLPPRPLPRGNFICFRHSAAAELHRRLLLLNVVTDHREDRLRFGFGVYHDEADVTELVGRIRAVKL